MVYKKNLLVTFPVDLGNQSYEANFHAILSQDLDFYRFPQDKTTKLPGLIGTIFSRVKSAFALRKIVRSYTSDGKKVIFHGISPALFAFGAWKPSQTAIVLDWTRNLYLSIQGKPLKKDWIFRLHRKVVNKVSMLLCMTDAILHNLEDVYEVRNSSLYRVHAPLLVDNLDIYPRSTPSKPRVLFVGGALRRKGGDVLLAAYRGSLRDKCSLTMMTNDVSARIDGVNFLSGISYGTAVHKKTFEEHDIFILPTRRDSYPVAIAEAAAAGLAVITTKFALGSKEVIIDGETGCIADSPEECITKLERLLDNPALIDKFKVKGYQYIHKKFAKEEIRKSYLTILNRNV